MFTKIFNHWRSNVHLDDELRDKSGTGTDYTCDNTSCKRAFHSICLMDWLRSITTTRQYVKSLVSPSSFHWLMHEYNVALLVILIFCNRNCRFRVYIYIAHSWVMAYLNGLNLTFRFNDMVHFHNIIKEKHTDILRGTIRDMVLYY
jgi:hypothetical protein